jgi:dipeptidyl aminopeptidase/acylaminoacyl peptidase
MTSCLSAVIALGALVVCGGVAPVEGQTQAPVPLPIETALAQPSFPFYSPVLLSPDGNWVAYSLHYPNLTGRAEPDSWFDATGTPGTANGVRIRITELRTGRTVGVGNEDASNWGPSWSPDGRRLAFYSNADGAMRLWVRETATGRTRRVSHAIMRADRMIGYPRWTPDSRRVVVPILPYGSALPEGNRVSKGPSTNGASERDSATVTVMRADPAQRYGGQFTGGRSMSNLTSLRADLALVDVETGAVTTLAHGYRPHEFEVAPSGRFVVFTSLRAAMLRPRWTVPYDVVVVALDAPKPAPPRIVAAAAPLSFNARSVLWSPDGATLVYSATDSAGRTRFFAADSTDWRPRRIAASDTLFDTDSTFNVGQAAWWDEDGRTVYGLAPHGLVAVSMPDGALRSISRAPAGYESFAIVGSHAPGTVSSKGDRSLIVAIHNDSTKRTGFARVDLTTGTWQILLDENRYIGRRSLLSTDVARDGRMVFLSEDSQHPRDVWTAGPGVAAPRQLTHTAPEMERVPLGKTRLIDFTTASGSPRRATLLLPAGYRPGQRYPLVVYPYPIDPRSNYVNLFGVTGTGVDNMQLLATRGFAVLAPDVAPFDFKDQMRELASIVQRAVDRVIELGVADSTRLGITGQSWGGCTTLDMIVQTDRFGAAVMRGGMGDQVSTTAILQAGGFAFGMQLTELYFGATPWEQPELYHRNSPIYLLDRVHTPLLILHGEGDTTVPIFLADQVFAGLQRLGKEVEYVRYANENHNESAWSRANQRDFLTRLIGWFESNLKGDRVGRPAVSPRTH